MQYDLPSYRAGAEAMREATAEAGDDCENPEGGLDG